MANYCTKEQLKNNARLDIQSVKFDAGVDEIIESVSRRIDRHCNMVDNAFLQSTDSVRYFQRNDVRGQTPYLDHPLLSITTLTRGDSSTLSSSAYRLYPRNQSHYYQIRLLSGYSWLWTTDGEISIDGAWGYSTTVPTPIREAALVYAGWVLKRYQAGLQDATASVDLGQLIYNEVIPRQVIFWLEPYVNHVRSII